MTLEVPVDLTKTDNYGHPASKPKTEVLLAAGTGMITNYAGKILYSGYVEFGKISGKGTVFNTGIQKDSTDHLCQFVEQMNPGLKEVHFLKRAKSFRSPWHYYEGEWRNNKLHGWGMIRYLSGAVFEGHFYNGWIHGLGTFTSGELVVTGSWKENQLLQLIPSKMDIHGMFGPNAELPSRPLSARPLIQTFTESREPQFMVEEKIKKFRGKPELDNLFEIDEISVNKEKLDYYHPVKSATQSNSKPQVEIKLGWRDLDEDFKDFESFDES